jgi:hypothetical protein
VSAVWIFLPVLGSALLHAPVLALDLFPALKRPLDGGRSDVAFFGRVESETDSTANSSYIAGARYRFAF